MKRLKCALLAGLICGVGGVGAQDVAAAEPAVYRPQLDGLVDAEATSWRRTIRRSVRGFERSTRRFERDVRDFQRDVQRDIRRDFRRGPSVIYRGHPGYYYHQPRGFAGFGGTVIYW